MKLNVMLKAVKNFWFAGETYEGLNALYIEDIRNMAKALLEYVMPKSDDDEAIAKAFFSFVSSKKDWDDLKEEHKEHIKKNVRYFRKVFTGGEQKSKDLEISPIWTEGQIEALARVLCNKAAEHGQFNVWEGTEYKSMFIDCARAAVEFMRVGPPVDLDAWKTPLVINNGSRSVKFCSGIVSGYDVDLFNQGKHDSGMKIGNPADIAKLAVHAASYAGAHGCPVNTPEAEGITLSEARTKSIAQLEGAREANKEPIATPETLEGLGDIGQAAFEAASKDGRSVNQCNQAFAAAILRAAQVYVDLSPNDLRGHCITAELLSFLNSRIRYRVAASTETPKGLLGVDHVWKMITSIVDEMSDSDGNDYVELSRSDVSDLIVELRPWLRDPVGWELDVTAEEIEAAYYDSTVPASTRYSQFMLDLCRARIRPTFECQECAGHARSEQEAWSLKNQLTARINAARAALEGE